jgi:hypothetical protein
MVPPNLEFCSLTDPHYTFVQPAPQGATADESRLNPAISSVIREKKA